MFLLLYIYIYILLSQESCNNVLFSPLSPQGAGTHVFSLIGATSPSAVLFSCSLVHPPFP